MADKNIAIGCRVSTTQQGRKGNLIGQEARLSRTVLESGGDIAYVGKFEWSGRGQQWLDKLKAFGRKATERGSDMALFGTLDRLMRSLHFDSDDPVLCKAMPTLEQVEQAVHAIGLPVMILNGPEATTSSNRGRLIEWGNPGRPKEDKSEGYKKRIREELLEEALRLLGIGLSPRLVSCLTGIGVPTLKLWRGKYTLPDRE